jgi:hypothetical protein
MNVAVFETTNDMKFLVDLTNPIDEVGPGIPAVKQDIAGHNAALGVRNLSFKFKARHG